MFWFKKNHSKLLLLTEENHCILIYILDDCSFSIMITFFFYIKTQSIWLPNCVFKFKSLHHKTQSSNKEIQENKLQSLQQFWWIYTEWNTMRWIFHTEKNILCFSWNSKKSSVEIPNTNFDWFTRNDTSWNDYFIHTNLLCFT